MANPGRNEGFHVLDDFVCEAIHNPSLPLANPANQGRNEGMTVVEEAVFDASSTKQPEDKEKERLGPSATSAARLHSRNPTSGKKNAAPPARSNNEIRTFMLQYFYDRNRTAT